MRSDLFEGADVVDSDEPVWDDLASLLALGGEQGRLVLQLLDDFLRHAQLVHRLLSTGLCARGLRRCYVRLSTVSVMLCYDQRSH